MRSSPTIRRLRAASPLIWAGLGLWLWATAVLPALHAAQHAREAETARGFAPHRQRVQHLVDEVLGRTQPEGPSHSHHHGAPGPHGKGSPEHLGVAFVAVAVFAPPTGFQAVELAPALPMPPPPALISCWRPQHPRGPPSLLTAFVVS